MRCVLTDMIKPNCAQFGKDISTGNYKMVWLYNSFDLNLRGPTTCEVFDFTTNTWRYVNGSTHRIRDYGCSTYADGSVYWITTDKFEKETKILSFNLQTEVFQVMSETPIIHAYPHWTIMCSLNSCLCVSVLTDTSQEIWTLNPHKTWEKQFSINVGIESFWFGKVIRPISPVVMLEGKKLLLQDNSDIHPGLVLHDTRIDSYSFISSINDLNEAYSYFPSLISI